MAPVPMSPGTASVMYGPDSGADVPTNSSVPPLAGVTAASASAERGSATNARRRPQRARIPIRAVAPARPRPRAAPDSPLPSRGPPTASPAGRRRHGEQRNKKKPDPWPEDPRQSQYEPTHKPPSKEHSSASPDIVTVSRYKSIVF